MTFRKMLVMTMIMVMVLAGCSSNKSADYEKENPSAVQDSSIINKSEEYTVDVKPDRETDDGNVIYHLDGYSDEMTVTARVYRLNDQKWQKVAESSVEVNGLLTVSVIDGALSEGSFYEFTEKDQLAITVTVNDRSVDFTVPLNISGIYSVNYLCTDRISVYEETPVGYIAISQNRQLFTSFDESYFSDASSLPDSDADYRLYAVTLSAE